MGVRMLKERPNPEDWEKVLFTNQCHFTWGPKGKLLIIRKRGERYDPRNIQHRCRRPDKEGQK